MKVSNGNLNFSVDDEIRQFLKPTSVHVSHAYYVLYTVFDFKETFLDVTN